MSVDAIRGHIRKYQQHFVVTRMDKMPGVYVLMGKQLYRQQTLDDLQTSGYYATAGTVPTAQATVTAAMSSPAFQVAQWAYPSRDAMMTQLQGFPYASLLVKMHKTPVKMRFFGLQRPQWTHTRGQDCYKGIPHGFTFA